MLSVCIIAERGIILYTIATLSPLSWDTGVCMLIDLPLEYKISRSALLLPSEASHAPKLHFSLYVLLCSIGTHIVYLFPDDRDMDVLIAVGVDRVCSLLMNCHSSVTKNHFLRARAPPVV